MSSRTNAYNGQSGATWKISGQVTKAAFKATITYNGTLRPGYKVTLVGKVAKDGSVSGTARSSQARRSGSPCRPGRSSRCCTTSRQPRRRRCSGTTRRSGSPSQPPCRGWPEPKVTVKVHDGGPGRAHDTYAHGVTGTHLSPYPIIGGPGVTMR